MAGCPLEFAVFAPPPYAVVDVTERLLEAKEIAERLGVPVTWVRESARSGAIPCVRLGRYVRFDVDDVDRWLEECKRPGRPVEFRSVRPT